MRRRLLALAAAAALAPVATALGWGAEGHRVVGEIAQQLLSPRARQALEDLGGGRSLAELSLVLDRDKRELSAAYPGSPRWHYDNRPACAADAPLASYCGDGNCASRAYSRYLAVLGDRRAPPAERLFALEVVAHVLGDVHQPLHVADHDDRGGNDVRVLSGRGGRAKPLHAAWDVEFVRRAADGDSPRAFARRLVQQNLPRRRELEAGDFAAWTAESHTLARADAYGRLPGFACGAAEARRVQLPAAYVEVATRDVSEQLARAGFRLARVLEAAL